MIPLLFAISIFAALIAVLVRFKPVWDAGNAVKRDSLANSEGEAEMSILSAEGRGGDCPKVSVVVYSFTEEDEIFSYLEAAMNQDYPDYEVIIVNEGGAETTASLAKKLKAIYPERLYVTFIPEESRSLSRRKLAFTVGIKAASGEVVLTTTSNCRIPSRRWLTSMMRPFVEGEGIDVVLGYSHFDFDSLQGAGKWYRQMNATLSACQWIGAAYNRRPFRGDGNNLAFRRKLFFDCKGYSKTMHLVGGDDDVFLTEIMNRRNTTTSISADSILVTEWGESANRILSEQRERHQFTSWMLPCWPFLRAGLGSLMQWVMALSALAAAVVGFLLLSGLNLSGGLDAILGWRPETNVWYAIVPALVALGIVMLNWLAEVMIYRRTARKLGSVCLWWSLPWFLLWHPVGNLFFKIKTLRRRRKNYTFA